MEKRMSAYEAWYQAQYVVGKTAVLDYILEEIAKWAKKGNYSINWRTDFVLSTTTPPIREFFNNKSIRDYALEILVNLGYEVNYDEGMRGYLRIKWGPSEPPKPL